MLKAPCVPGTPWQATTTTYLLQWRNGFPREIRHTYPSIPLQYEIEALDKAVETPAGRVASCLRVEGSAAVCLYVDPAAGSKVLPLTTREWYCPGIGLARLERIEPAGSGFLISATLRMEFGAWQ